MRDSISSQALIPSILGRYDYRIFAEAAAFVGGLLMVCVLAQVAFPLPWTPVPITGQTLGVSLVALSWGRKRAARIMMFYLLLGYLGLPVFSLGRTGVSLGASTGYMIGMVFASYVVGYLADAGFTNSFKKSFIAASVGSFFVLGFGLIGLSFFVPKEVLLTSGLLPFLPGDVIKNTFAALFSSKLKSLVK